MEETYTKAQKQAYEKALKHLEQALKQMKTSDQFCFSDFDDIRAVLQRHKRLTK